MDPTYAAGICKFDRLPRTRGDGPAGLEQGTEALRASPHTRGWTLVHLAALLLGRGFPAHAGMDPCASSSAQPARRLPRTRGDGPDTPGRSMPVSEASPHTRGWTGSTRERRRAPRGFPAHAGMDPIPAARWQGLARLPRTRGDGPVGATPLHPSRPASPHTRGWTPRPRPAGWPAYGFPAHAGMDLADIFTEGKFKWLPRTRGDGPAQIDAGTDTDPASPHTRGWTRSRRHRAPSGKGFPAHAGMDPAAMIPVIMSMWLPRTRGDGPLPRGVALASNGASPHTRGWTVRLDTRQSLEAGFPAHAGMDPLQVEALAQHERLPRTRGDGPLLAAAGGGGTTASPHTRGWTLDTLTGELQTHGFPAHAGMDPTGRAATRHRSRLPRTRGDGPLHQRRPSRYPRASPHTRGWTPLRGRRQRFVHGFPAHAGMDPSRPHVQMSASGLPRTRGDGPVVHRRGRVRYRASPHTRGWTSASRRLPVPDHGFPAHAGMDPRSSRFLMRPSRLPRTRGDGPVGSVVALRPNPASPHTRGWTVGAVRAVHAERGFPAHAGMDPSASVSTRSHTGLPRTRGDGPDAAMVGAVPRAASPHTRGWTLRLARAVQRLTGFPAHAGMDPTPARGARSRCGLPRTRGDGPTDSNIYGLAGAASPHTRGWTGESPQSEMGDPGFPAHAGMDPRSRSGP